MKPSAVLQSGVLDMTAIETLRSLGGPGEPDVFAELVGLFIADAEARLLELKSAIAANSAETVTQVAHRLRGGALEMGAVRMAPVCAAIEHAARAGSLVHAEAMAEVLRREFAAARAALELAARP